MSWLYQNLLCVYVELLLAYFFPSSIHTKVLDLAVPPLPAMDAIISAVITPVIDAILKPLIGELGYLLNPGSNMRRLKKISRELNQIKDEVHEKIVRASEESDDMVPTKQATEWMREVQTLEEDVIAKVDEDYDRQKACLPLNCWLSYRVGKRASKAVLEVEDLMRKRQQFEGVVVRCAPAIRRMPTPPEGTLSSTEMYLREAVDYIQNDEVGMVGIWGMGGVGKTTLLQKINNHPSIADIGFDYVIWVVASQDLNPDRFRKEIAERVGLGGAGLQSQTLYHYLEMKKFLLLLDDIWEHFELTTVGIPYPRPGNGVKSKVVFTTRLESVCDQMVARPQLVHMGCKKIKIECLRQEAAWKLFLSNVGEGMQSIIKSDQRISKRAKIVADKCGGLPLALVVIARTMSANKTWQEWEDAINMINTNRIQEMWNERGDPFPLLKISYDHLRDDIMRECFLCCALWPEDHEIKVSKLIDSWLGMDLIDYCGDIGATYRRGYSIVEWLKRACLLERADNYHSDCVKMHDIVRGTALWIVSSNQRKWMVKNRANLTDESEDAMQWREAETISLSYKRSWILPQHPDCPKLLSLMLSWNNIDVIHNDFFQNMLALTFLDLSCNAIKEVPPAIGGLIQLQHLNLSDNPICSLPVEMENLAGLKVLLLNYLQCLIFPKLSKFHKLGHLGVINRYTGKKYDKGEKALIEGVIHSKITSLDFHLKRLEIIDQLIKNPSVSFRRLKISKLEGVTSLPLPSLLRIGNTSSTLSRLHIQFCNELEDILISNQCEVEFDNLEHFRLYHLPILKKIILSGPMPGSLIRSVRFMVIEFCSKLKSATWILHCPHIESLEIRWCEGMEHVIGNDEDGSSGDVEVEEAILGKMEQEENLMVLFPHLRYLKLEGLPALCFFSTSTHAIAFPSLKKLQIINCPLLDEAPFSHLEIFHA